MTQDVFRLQMMVAPRLRSGDEGLVRRKRDPGRRLANPHSAGYIICAYGAATPVLRRRADEVGVQARPLCFVGADVFTLVAP